MGRLGSCLIFIVVLNGNFIYPPDFFGCVDLCVQKPREYFRECSDKLVVVAAPLTNSLNSPFTELVIVSRRSRTLSVASLLSNSFLKNVSVFPIDLFKYFGGVGTKHYE